MNKKNKTIKILVIIGIALVVWGFIMMFISSVKKDQKEMNSRMETITNSYKDFTKKIEEFNKKRDELHKEFLDKVYYETLATQDTGFKNKLKEYEEMVSNISLSTKDNLRKYCVDDIYYSSADVNNKCAAYKLAYEEMVNSFVDDINRYNSNLTQYNNWLDANGKTDSIHLEAYQTKKKYVDYNKDGEYSGKEDTTSKTDDKSSTEDTTTNTATEAAQ